MENLLAVEHLMSRQPPLLRLQEVTAAAANMAKNK